MTAEQPTGNKRAKRTWSPDELTLLKRLNGKVSLTDQSDVFQRSRRGIINKRTRERITILDGARMTVGELHYKTSVSKTTVQRRLRNNQYEGTKIDGFWDVNPAHAYDPKPTWDGRKLPSSVVVKASGENCVNCGNHFGNTNNLLFCCHRCKAEVLKQVNYKRKNERPSSDEYFPPYLRLSYQNWLKSDAVRLMVMHEGVPAQPEDYEAKYRLRISSLNDSEADLREKVFGLPSFIYPLELLEGFDETMDADQLSAWFDTKKTILSKEAYPELYLFIPRVGVGFGIRHFLLKERLPSQTLRQLWQREGRPVPIRYVATNVHREDAEIESLGEELGQIFKNVGSQYGVVLTMKRDTIRNTKKMYPHLTLTASGLV